MSLERNSKVYQDRINKTGCEILSNDEAILFTKTETRNTNLKKNQTRLLAAVIAAQATRQCSPYGISE